MIALIFITALVVILIHLFAARPPEPDWDDEETAWTAVARENYQKNHTK